VPARQAGPDQAESFVIPAFAAQIARIERSEQEPVMHVGQLEGRKDILDVRDIVRAYVDMILHFDTLPNG
jgi:GDP-4-dehydro-6-deoxy-D-mannose reductase